MIVKAFNSYGNTWEFYPNITYFENQQGFALAQEDLELMEDGRKIPVVVFRPRKTNRDTQEYLKEYGFTGTYEEHFELTSAYNDVLFRELEPLIGWEKGMKIVTEQVCDLFSFTSNGKEYRIVKRSKDDSEASIYLLNDSGQTVERF